MKTSPTTLALAISTYSRASSLSRPGRTDGATFGNSAIIRRVRTSARVASFTLVEVMVATMLVAVAVMGVFGGIKALGAADARARSADLLQGLAAEKLNDVKILSDPGADGNQGDFSDRGYPGVTWTVDAQPSGATNVDQVTVTASQGRESQSLTTLTFVRPLTGATTP
jgi:Tfp pilus assembly protein PilV